MAGRRAGIRGATKSRARRRRLPRRRHRRPRLRRQRQAESDRGLFDPHPRADVAGVIDALGEKQAILIGHDWGAPIAWNTALFHPDKVRAVAGLSVPHLGRGPMPRIQLFRRLYKDRFFYMLYFQEPGTAEAELEPTCARRCGKSIIGSPARA